MTSISYVCTHAPWSPERRATVLDLKRQIPGLVVVEDYDRAGVWPTSRRAWKLATGDGHTCVLQDDVIPCGSFVHTVEALVDARPDHCIYLYCPRKAADDALRAQGRWLRVRDPLGSLGVVMPNEMAQRWLQWLSDVGFEDDWHRSYDVRLKLWLMEHQIEAWCPVPSVVEHACPTSSLLSGHNHPRRVARQFVGAHVDGATVDWSAGIDDAPVTGSAQFVSYAKANGLDPHAMRAARDERIMARTIAPRVRKAAD